jgi:hypothetical protein
MPDDNTTAFSQARLVLYDLSDGRAWELAIRERRAWGREQSEIFSLGPDHILIVFFSGAALEASA